MLANQLYGEAKENLRQTNIVINETLLGNNLNIE